MRRIKKRYIFSGIFILIVALVLFFLSTIVKKWVVKNSEELIGRKVEIAELHFNYLKMSVKASGVVMYEANKTDRFVSFHEFFADFSPWKLLNNEYSLSKISIDSLQANIIQNSTGFNFDDLIPAEDSSAVAEPDTTASDLKFSLYNVALTNGDIKYEDRTLNNVVELKNLNLELPLIAWNQNQSDMGAKFNIGEQGIVDVAAVVNSKENHYQFNIKTTDIPIHPILPYLKDYADISQLDGLLTSDIQINGDMVDLMNIVVSGSGKLDSLSVKDGRSEEIIKAAEVRARMNELNLKTFHFGFTNIEIDQPVMTAVLDKDMSNLERFLLPYFKADSIQSSPQLQVADTIVEPDVTYSIDTLIVNKGEIRIADNTLNRPFYSSINNLDLTMLHLTESSDHVPVSFSAKLNDEGIFKGNTVFSLIEPMNFEFDGQLKKLDLISFSPYSEYYIASPLTQGWFNYDLQIKMTPKWIKNNNKIKIEELEFGKKTGKPQYRVPLRLALYILKDVNDNINIDLPVSGSTSDPHFKIGKLIWKTFSNLMIKTAASPFLALSDLAGTNPEKLEYVPFALTQDSLDQQQRTALSSLAKIMSKKPKLQLIMSQRTDEGKEKAQLAILLVKEKYEKEKQIAVLQENSDTTFEAYLRQLVPAMDSIGMGKACLQVITPNEVEQKFRTLLNHRDELVRNFFVTQGLPEESVQVSTADLKTLPKELQRPEFKVEVSLK